MPLDLGDLNNVLLDQKEAFTLCEVNKNGHLIKCMFFK